MPRKERTIFEKSPPVWKVRDMIEKLGGTGELTEKLMARGFFPPPNDTVAGWSQRNSLPGAWAPAVFGLAMDAGLIEHPMDAYLPNTRLTPRREKYPPK